jgi:hypothetical protein
MRDELFAACTVEQANRIQAGLREEMTMATVCGQRAVISVDRAFGVSPPHVQLRVRADFRNSPNGIGEVSPEAQDLIDTLEFVDPLAFALAGGTIREI